MSSQLDEVCKKYGYKGVNVATWRDPNLSVLPGGRGPRSGFKVAPSEISKPFIPTYKVKYPLPEPTDDEDSGDEVKDEGKEENEAAHVDSPLEQNSECIAADQPDEAGVTQKEQSMGNDAGERLARNEEPKDDVEAVEPNGTEPLEEPNAGETPPEETDGPNITDEVSGEQPSEPAEAAQIVDPAESAPENDEIAIPEAPKDADGPCGGDEPPMEQEPTEDKKVAFAPGTPEPRPTHRKKKSAKGTKGRKRRTVLSASDIPPDVQALIDSAFDGVPPPPPDPPVVQESGPPIETEQVASDTEPAEPAPADPEPNFDDVNIPDANPDDPIVSIEEGQTENAQTDAAPNPDLADEAAADEKSNDLDGGPDAEANDVPSEKPEQAVESDLPKLPPADDPVVKEKIVDAEPPPPPPPAPPQSDETLEPPPGDDPVFQEEDINAEPPPPPPPPPADEPVEEKSSKRKSSKKSSKKKSSKGKSIEASILAGLGIDLSDVPPPPPPPGPPLEEGENSVPESKDKDLIEDTAASDEPVQPEPASGPEIAPESANANEEPAPTSEPSAESGQADEKIEEDGAANNLKQLDDEIQKAEDGDPNDVEPPFTVDAADTDLKDKEASELVDDAAPSPVDSGIAIEDEEREADTTEEFADDSTVMQGGDASLDSLSGSESLAEGDISQDSSASADESVESALNEVADSAEDIGDDNSPPPAPQETLESKPDDAPDGGEQDQPDGDAEPSAPTAGAAQSEESGEQRNASGQAETDAQATDSVTNDAPPPAQGENEAMKEAPNDIETSAELAEHSDPPTDTDEAGQAAPETAVVEKNEDPAQEEVPSESAAPEDDAQKTGESEKPADDAPAPEAKAEEASAANDGGEGAPTGQEGGEEAAAEKDGGEEAPASAAGEDEPSADAPANDPVPEGDSAGAEQTAETATPVEVAPEENLAPDKAPVAPPSPVLSKTSSHGSHKSTHWDRPHKANPLKEVLEAPIALKRPHGRRTGSRDEVIKRDRERDRRRRRRRKSDAEEKERRERKKLEKKKQEEARALEEEQRRVEEDQKRRERHAAKRAERKAREEEDARIAREAALKAAEKDAERRRRRRQERELRERDRKEAELKDELRDRRSKEKERERRDEDRSLRISREARTSMSMTSRPQLGKVFSGESVHRTGFFVGGGSNAGVDDRPISRHSKDSARSPRLERSKTSPAIPQSLTSQRSRKHGDREREGEERSERSTRHGDREHRRRRPTLDERERPRSFLGAFFNRS